MAGTKKINSDLDLQGKAIISTVPNSTGTVVTWNPTSKELGTRSNANIISDLGLITATNIAAAYYTKTQLKTSGDAQVHWGNLTNVPTTFTPSVHNHDDRYYLKSESVPYTGADKTVDLNTQELQLSGTLNKQSSLFEISHLGNNTFTSGYFKRLTDVASLTLSSSTAPADIIITLPIRTSTRWMMEVDIFSNITLAEKLIISAYHTPNGSAQVSCLTDTEVISEVKFCRDTNNNTVLILKRATGTSSLTYGKVNINNFYHGTTYHADLANKSNYKVEFIDESTLTGITVNSTIKVDKVNFGTKNVDFTSGAISKTQNGIRHFRDVYQAYSVASNIDKILSIKFPPQSTGAAMFRVEIDFYQYAANSGNYVGKLIVSFYVNNSTTVNATSGLSAQWLGNLPLPTNLIKVGIDSLGRFSINLGDPTTDWLGFFGFRVSSLDVRHTQFNHDYSKGWTHEFVSDETGYTGLVTVPLTISANQDWVTAQNYFKGSQGDIVKPTDASLVGTFGNYKLDVTNHTSSAINFPEVSAAGVAYTLNGHETQKYRTLTLWMKVGGGKLAFRGYNSAGVPSIWRTLLDDSSEVATNSHTHSNKAFLDVINQNLGTTHSPTFNGITVGYAIASNRGFNSSLPFAFLNGGSAQIIYTGGILASNAYADNTKIPTNGIYSKGNILTSGGFAKEGGTASQFLKADGSVDSKLYFHNEYFKGKQVGSVTNLNDSLPDGGFLSSYNTAAWGGTDRPTGADYGGYIKFSGHNTDINNLDFYYNNGNATLDGRLWFRTKNESGLTSWKEIWHSNNFNPANYASSTHTHTIAQVTGLQTALDGKVDDSQVLTNVPAGAVFTDTVYSHPTNSGNKHIPSGGSANQILRWSADGTAVWSNENNTTYSAYSGSIAGLVPQRAAGGTTTKYLREDGTWTVPPDNNTTYSQATTSTLGLVKPFHANLTTPTIQAATATASRYYGVQLNSSGQMVVNVPWVDTVYTNGTGLTLSGTTFSIDPTVLLDIASGKEAHSWGNHASVGYLTSESDPTVPSHVKSITSTNINNWNTAYGWGNHASAGYALSSQLSNYLPLSGGQLTGELSIKHSPSLIQPTHEFKTNQAGGRNDFYLRSDDFSKIIRFTTANSYYLFDIAGGMSASNQTGFDFIQIPAWNAQFRVGYYATQLPSYMSAVAGNSWTGGNMDAGGDVNAGGQITSESGFVHNQHNSPDAVLISDGSVADLGVDVVNTGGSLRIQDYFEDISGGVIYYGSQHPHKLVHLHSSDSTIKLAELEVGQRIVIMNLGGNDGWIEIDDNKAYYLQQGYKVTLYVASINSEYFFYDESRLTPYTP